MSRQEQHWAGEGGNAYHARQTVHEVNRVPFWEAILKQIDPDSILDIGCAEGWNQRAIKIVDPDLSTMGIDINVGALAKAREAGLTVSLCRAIDVADQFGNACADLVVHSGVLIHVPPEDFPATTRAIYDAANRYVLCIEYEGEREEEIEYRGERGLLWKRPWGVIYEELGMTVIMHGPAVGYDRCMFWLLRK